MATQAAKKTATRANVVRKPSATRQAEAPLYEVTEQSYIDNRLLEPGSTVVYYGVPGRALRPLNEAAKANKAAAREVRNDPDHDDADARATALRELDNDLQGVKPRADLYDDDDDDGPADPPLPDAQRKQLEKQALAGQQEQSDKEDADTNRVKVKLSGDPNHPHNPPESSLQGATPVTDGKSKK